MTHRLVDLYDATSNPATTIALDNLALAEPSMQARAADLAVSILRALADVPVSEIAPRNRTAIRAAQRMIAAYEDVCWEHGMLGID